MEKKLKLELTEKELNIIAKALSMMPYNEVVTLINDLSKQINAQSEKKA